MDPNQPLAQAFSVTGSRFEAVGSTAEIMNLKTAGVRVIDLSGRNVVPGLIDAHVHFSWFSFGLMDLNLDGVASLGEALRLVANRVQETPPGYWIRGYGFNANEWERWPTREDLDSVAHEHPVVLNSKDFHSIWVNTLALRMAGVTQETTPPFGGEIEWDSHGDPTGIFKENAIELIWRVVPARGRQEFVDAIRLGIIRAHEVGVTSVQDMDPVDCFFAFQRLQASDELKLRVFKQIPESALSAAISTGVTTGFGNEWLRIGCLKLFADGSLGSQTAHMIEPFENRPGYRGVPVHTPAELDELVRTAVSNDIAVAIHAIGDMANRIVLNSFERVADLAQQKRLRNRVEHVQLVAAEEIPRFAQLDVLASMQPSHAPSDRYTADRFWGHRAQLAYAVRSLLDAGARLAFGSDVPVEPLDPLAGIHAAVWRKRLNQPESEPWYPAQRLTVHEALEGFTIGAAYASGEEGIKGSITAGKLADFVVLDRDITAGDEATLRSVRPLSTVVGGSQVYGPVDLA